MTVLLVELEVVAADSTCGSHDGTALKYVKQHARCLELGGELDDGDEISRSEHTRKGNWLEDILLKPAVSSVFAEYVGMGSFVGSGVSEERLLLVARWLEGFRDSPEALHLDEAAAPDAATRAIFNHFNKSLPIYAGLCGEDEDVHHLRTMQCAGLINLHDGSVGSSSDGPTVDDPLAAKRKQTAYRKVFGGDAKGGGRLPSRIEGFSRQRLWCRALLTCEGGRGGLLDLCQVLIQPLERMLGAVLAVPPKYLISSPSDGLQSLQAGEERGMCDGHGAPTLVADVQTRLINTEKQRLSAQLEEEQAMSDEEAVEKLRRGMIARFKSPSRGESDDLFKQTLARAQLGGGEDGAMDAAFSY